MSETWYHKERDMQKFDTLRVRAYGDYEYRYRYDYPKAVLKTIKRSGLGANLFHEMPLIMMAMKLQILF